VGEQDYRLFRMVDDSVCQIGLVIQNQRDVVLAGDVLRGDDREFIPRDFAFKDNPKDAAARARTPERSAIQHAGKGEVVDVAGLPGNLVAPFFSGHRPTDDFCCHFWNPFVRTGARRAAPLLLP